MWPVGQKWPAGNLHLAPNILKEKKNTSSHQLLNKLMSTWSFSLKLKDVQIKYLGYFEETPWAPGNQGELLEI